MECRGVHAGAAEPIQGAFVFALLRFLIKHSSYVYPCSRGHPSPGADLSSAGNDRSVCVCSAKHYAAAAYQPTRLR
jgi:hypothetical protein